MSDEMRDTLTLAGINMETLLERLGQNELLLHRLLGKFLEDRNYGILEEAMRSGDREKALTASHTLKGISGNLSMDQLYQTVTAQVEAIRADDWNRAKQAMPEITMLYENLRSGIGTTLKKAN